MIKLILDSLHPEQRKLIFYAFEHDMSQYIKLDNNRFIGVNITHLPFLKIEESAGVWAIGEIK